MNVTEPSEFSVTRPFTASPTEPMLNGPPRGSRSLATSAAPVSVSAVSSFVVALSSTAVGAPLAGCTVIVTVAVAVCTPNRPWPCHALAPSEIV